MKSADMINSYAALEGGGARLLPLNGIWKSKEDLKEVVCKYGLTFGFKACSTGWSFTCNKAGKTRDAKVMETDPLQEKRRRKGDRSLKA